MEKESQAGAGSEREVAMREAEVTEAAGRGHSLSIMSRIKELRRGQRAFSENSPPWWDLGLLLEEPLDCNQEMQAMPAVLPFYPLCDFGQPSHCLPFGPRVIIYKAVC